METALTRHQVETELSDIRREIARLRRREATLIDTAEEKTAPRPGWPMQRAARLLASQASGAMISTSAPSRIAV